MLDTSKIYSSNSYGDFKVVKYESAIKITIEFVSTRYKTIVEATRIRNGKVKDRLYPSIYGIGFMGAGVHKCSHKKGVATRKYRTWFNMLQRCYSPEYHKKQPTYKDCTVCDEWHNYQVFAEWYDKNYIKGFALDKDIKVKGNKVYSPETCLFVSPKDNVVKANAKSYAFTSPTGDAVNIYNMREFCEVNNLNSGNMASVSTGKRKSHKGWVKS